ncbi:MAG TPA: LamG domain-containing protein [Phycisphaerae bacterium]|nr:LamG domain-containing protein [Phycisphaerae bacterium]
MHRVIVVAVILALCSVVAMAAVDEGLVAYYPFDAGTGTVAHDRSGNGNDGKLFGGVKWVKGSFGSALEFDGKDGYVDCGKDKSLDISAAGTLMIWCRPKTVQGGIAGWVLDTSWIGARLLFSVDTWHPGANILGCVADGEEYQGFSGYGSPPKDTWTHLAYTFDGKRIAVYLNGVLMTTHAQQVTPVLKDVNLWIGKSLGVSQNNQDHFHGLLDELRIYNRALSSKEIVTFYKQEAPARGKNLSLLEQLELDVQPWPEPGKIIAMINARAMQPLPQGTILIAELDHDYLDIKRRKPIRQLQTSDIPVCDPTELIFDAANLKPGKYIIRARALGPNRPGGKPGKQIGREASMRVEWTGQPEIFKKMKILNNLCWELLNVKPGSFGAIGKKQEFTLPYERWVFIRTIAEVGKNAGITVRLDSKADDAIVIAHTENGETTLETMRYLTGGEHTLYITSNGEAKLKHLVVRAIPELQHAFYGADTRLRPQGPFDWKFLTPDVLPNITTMVAGLQYYKRGDAFERLAEWKKMGRRWIAYSDIPKAQASGEDAVEKVYEYWAERVGYANPLVDGIMVDEFGGGDRATYDIYRQVVEKLNANPAFKGKGFHPYHGSSGKFYWPGNGRGFVRACMAGGGLLVWERYFAELPTEEDLDRAIYREMTGLMPNWPRVFGPGCVRQMVLAFGVMSAPTENGNRLPTVDFKILMQKQMELIATHPAYFGLGGIQQYHSGYSDEENVRWNGRLYRHYAIEGNTEPLINDPYILTHIQNPDFNGNTDGWTIAPAQEGSIQPRKYKMYSRLQSRWDRTPIGDTFLWMKRSAGKPNKFSQEIKNLTPGGLYSMKMITSDYQDLIQEMSEEKRSHVSITIENAEILPGSKNSFQWPFPNTPIPKKFTDKNYYMNYHWRVFRAKGKTARLTVTDWKSDTEPGGPVGQELMFNFIEIQPYIGN